MSHTKPTVNERISRALVISDARNRYLAVRIAMLESILTQLCDHFNIQVEVNEQEAEQKAEEMLSNAN